MAMIALITRLKMFRSRIPVSSPTVIHSRPLSDRPGSSRQRLIGHSLVVVETRADRGAVSAPSVALPGSGCASRDPSPTWTDPMALSE